MKFQLPEPQTPIAYPSSAEELEALRVFHKKNLRPEMVGIHAMNGLAPHNSASRSVMMTQHIPQHLVISGLEKPYIISGPEYRLSKYTFNTKMPANGNVKAVINRYGWTAGAGGVRGTPERTIIFSREDNGRLDFLNVQEWSSYHTYFGFRNKIFPVTNRITEGANLPKDLVLADTPANTEDDCYCYGLNLETAFFDRRATAEDGAIVSRSALQRMKFRVFEVREVGMGSHEFPINLYGDRDNYKIFPDIGEEIRADGLIMATRPYSDRLSVATMSIDDVCEVDHYFDTKCYSRESILNKDVQEGIKNGTMKAQRGRVVDIKVIRNNSHNSMLPPLMTEQLNRYHTALVTYYSQVLDVVRKYEVEDRRRGGTGFVPMTPGLQSFLELARVLAGQGGNRFTGNIDIQYKRASLDEYTVYFVIEHEIVPNLGFKISDCNGSKSVIVSIREDEDMPMNHAGRRAEVVVSSTATIDRSNWGRNFGPYFAAAARDMTEWIRKELNLGKNATEEQMMLVDDATFNRVFDRLLLLYAITSPHAYVHYTKKVLDPALRRKHVLAAVNDKVTLFMPIDNPINNVDAVLHLEKHFPQVFDSVTDREESAEPTVSRNAVRIHPVYYMLLEKIADQGSATNMGRLQHHGLLAAQTRSEKHTLPYRPGPVRTLGEMEVNIYLLYSRTPKAVTELHDLSNNPSAMRHAYAKLLQHETPTNIGVLVDRNVIPYGQHRPLQFLQHHMFTQGAWIDYIPEGEALHLGLKENFDSFNP